MHANIHTQAYTYMRTYLHLVRGSIRPAAPKENQSLARSGRFPVPELEDEAAEGEGDDSSGDDDFDLLSLLAPSPAR